MKLCILFRPLKTDLIYQSYVFMPVYGYAIRRAVPCLWLRHTPRLNKENTHDGVFQEV